VEEVADTADGMDHMVAKVRDLMASLLLILKPLKLKQETLSVASLKASEEANAMASAEAKAAMEEEVNSGERKKPDLFLHHKRH